MSKKTGILFKPKIKLLRKIERRTRLLFMRISLLFKIFVGKTFFPEFISKTLIEKKEASPKKDIPNIM
jgi:hypothetical protein